MIWLVVGLLVFLGIHSLRIFVPTWRDKKVASLGMQKWQTVYSIISLLSFVLLIYGYSQARPVSGILYVPFDWGRPVAITLTFLAFCLLPFNMRSSRLKAITHHPFMLATILWSLAHLLANGDIASVILFGCFFIWSLLAIGAAIKRGGSLPPLAPLWQDVLAVGFAIILWVIFIMFAHNYLIGVAPIL